MIWFSIRTMKVVEGRNAHPGMWWVSIFGREPFKFLGHGGWVYFHPMRPIITFGWWKRHAVVIPRQRGWRWD